MDVCTGGYGSKGHDEICYTSRNCPLCEAIERIEELTKDLENAEKELDEAKDKVDEYLDLLNEYVPEGIL